ncbi:hypothetical protein [Streptacidiphilus cavernicola]|uniref:Uncharacterized protein n=1 Tax=Streptacidiphilus cavernicola TaxID=3342716 RepID=A0ABV6W250_9ACTN
MQETDLYRQLLVERYGPLRRLVAERHRRVPERPARAQRLDPDPDAALHLAALADAIATRRRSTRMPSPPPAPVPATPEPDRTPPVLGAMWCKSCESWCMPSGICRCNNR